MSSSDADSGGPTPRVHRAWSGVAFLVISAVIAVFLLGDAAVRAGIPRMLLFAPWVLLAVWLVYALSAASHVRTTADGVTVQNFMRRTSFGWSQLRDVDFRWQLEFSLADGSTLTAMGGPARSRPRRQTQREIEVEGRKPPAGVSALAEIRERWRAAPRSANAPIRRTWDWTALVVLFVLVVWAVAAIVITR